MRKNITIRLSATLAIDILAVCVVIFMGDLSAFFKVPLYQYDLMRLLVIFAIAFTPRWNGFLLAVLLPLASWYFGGHPHILKSSLMIIELLVNVWLFWFLLDRIRFSLLSMVLAILFSKLLYYTLKYLCISQGWISGELVSTPVDLQVITGLLYSIFIFIVFNIGGRKKK
jgi:hypothetical protein